jgi:hypothetical protein
MRVSTHKELTFKKLTLYGTRLRERQIDVEESNDKRKRTI